MEIAFRILGTVSAELRNDDGADPVELDLGPFKQRLLLAMLLCRGNGVVLVEQLIDALWWERPPRTAHKNIQVYISHLRKLLAVDGRPDRLRYRPPGYQLRLAATDVDALRFEDLSRSGRLALRRGDLAAAAASTRQALALWNGPALGDLLVSPAVRSEAARLDDRRVAVHEDCFEAELGLGHHTDVLEEIEGLVRRHPLRERLRSQQLTALYRDGRQAEALAEYDNLRQQLAAELGLAPSPALQELYRRILAGHPALSTPAAPAPAAPAPDAEVVAHLSGLPRPADDFTGRRDALARLVGLFGEGPAARQGRFVSLVGPPGSGTTTLALRAAQALAGRFPDGQLLLRMRNAQGEPRPVGELLEELLGRLGGGRDPAPAPPGWPATDGSTLLRGRLARLRMLLILDGVADEAQARPLLPGAGGCSVLLTGSRRLSGLEGAGHVSLGPFAETEALDLLGRIIGPDRVARSPQAAARLVHACGLLPLAVRIAGARLAGLEHLPLERYADRLADERRLLDELAVGDLSVRACFERYLRVLSTAERVALARVAGQTDPVRPDPGAAEELLERLAGVHAVAFAASAAAAGAAPCYVMPLPLRVFARQLPRAAPAPAGVPSAAMDDVAV